MLVLPLATWDVAIVYFPGSNLSKIAGGSTLPHFISLALLLDF